MDKIKLLIVSGGLAQAGSERWVYEICKNINKEVFEIGVLCSNRYKITESETNYDNFYYHKIKELGVASYELLDDYFIPSYWRRAVSKVQRTYKKFTNKPNIEKKITKLIQSYDFVCVVDFYNYSYIEKELDYCERDFCLVVHSHRAQYECDQYQYLDKTRKYKFLYFCPKQIEEVKSEGRSQESEFYFSPLVLDLSNHPQIFNPITGDEIIISIFTRISTAKPIDNFILAYAKIQEKVQKKCVLHIYGTVQNEEYYQKLKHLISTLNIDKDSILFMGHTHKIPETIRNDNVNVYWGLAINQSVGYASIEVASLGIPSFFWNFDKETDFNTVLEQTDNLMYVHNQIDDFVTTNTMYLNDGKRLADLAVKQQKYFYDRHDIKNRIKEFEEFVLSNVKK